VRYPEYKQSGPVDACLAEVRRQDTQPGHQPPRVLLRAGPPSLWTMELLPGQQPDGDAAADTRCTVAPAPGDEGSSRRSTEGRRLAAPQQLPPPPHAGSAGDDGNIMETHSSPIGLDPRGTVKGVEKPSWATRTPGQRLTGSAAKRDGKPRVYLPVPDGIDLAIPGIASAWLWFQRLDEDESGLLDIGEFYVLVKQLGLDWGKKKLKRAFQDMTAEAPRHQLGQASFSDFAHFWAQHRAMERRDMRRTVKELFDQHDCDKSGILDRQEFGKLMEAANKNPKLPAVVEMAETLHKTRDAETADETAGRKIVTAVPNTYSPIDADAAWEVIKKVAYDDGEVGINFNSFESWWKEKVGINDPDLPVLPEFMVTRIAEKIAAQDAWEDAMHLQSCGKEQKRKSESVVEQNWHSLRYKLKAMVRMQNQWGSLATIYDASSDSDYQEPPLPAWTRDPDSTFSMAWDLVSVLFLLYVTATVPLRACFGESVDLWSVGFYIDLLVDVFFITDVVLNLRTSFYDANGFRENRPRKMAVNYLKGWFFIDLVSCLPVGYVQYFINSGAGDGGSDFKAMKALRLMKMTKMMRLGRLKRILARGGTDVNIQQYLNIGFTIFAIVLMVHLLACFFYLVGEVDEQLANGVLVEGWVANEENWWGNNASDHVAKPAPEIVLATKYITSTYYVMNAVENGATTTERAFCVMADFAQDIILGLVASVITTISMSMSTDENETNLKLTRLKNWMTKAKLPKSFRVKVMQHFNETWVNQSDVDYPELMAQCPPAMAANLAFHIFGRFLTALPLFKGMSHEVITALCMRCTTLMVMKNQTIIRQGEHGKEMYVLMYGEVEVSVTRNGEETSLGFLAEGAFFGENPVLAAKDEAYMQLRMRTVKAMTRSQLCYITRDAVDELSEDYMELHARIARFRSSARVLNDRALRKLELSREHLKGLSSELKTKVEQVTSVRKKHNLDQNSYVPSKLLSEHMLTVIKAASKFKKTLMKDGVSCVASCDSCALDCLP
jgi:CRP-like cAMP-binding protein/Ca2+-binding EF-hand superfamily protein